MKKLALITFAALASVNLPAAIMAQDVEAGVSQVVNVDVTAMTPDHIANLISSSPVSTNHIDQVANAESVQVIDLGTMLTGAAQSEGAMSLEAAIDASAPGLAELRPALETNEFVMAALEAEGFAAEDVVALSVEAVGSLTIYVQSA